MMQPVTQRVVGILGGMGPEATAVFLHRLVELTPARFDQEHLKIVVVNNPKIPDRTAHIVGKGESPVPGLVEAARDLERLGADFIAIPCNTAHYFWQPIQDSVSIPVLNIVTETASRVRAELAPGQAVGVLGTRATLELGLYQKALQERGLQAICPDLREQAKVTRAIDEIKSKGDRQLAGTCLSECLEYLHSQGAEAAIYGCTELGLAPTRNILPIFDSLEILAQSSVRMGLGQESPAARSA